jgi:hypothetical protein
MERCKSFKRCSAQLCPLDPDLKKRVWYHDEAICNSKIYCKHRWINKQRSIQKNKTKRWLDKPITYDELYAASRPRKLTRHQKVGFFKRLDVG